VKLYEEMTTATSAESAPTPPPPTQDQEVEFMALDAYGELGNSKQV